jgi:hypothetical protein
MSDIEALINAIQGMKIKNVKMTKGELYNNPEYLRIAIDKVNGEIGSFEAKMNPSHPMYRESKLPSYMQSIDKLKTQLSVLQGHLDSLEMASMMERIHFGGRKGVRRTKSRKRKSSKRTSKTKRRSLKKKSNK